MMGNATRGITVGSNDVGPLLVLLRNATAPEISGVSWLTAGSVIASKAISKTLRAEWGNDRCRMKRTYRYSPV